MAVTYGFYNSLNGDRKYNAEQMSAIFDGVITDGVFGSIGGALMTIAGEGMQVLVKTGKAWFNSTWTLNDAQMALPIDTADVSLTRIDAVVLEVNSGVSTRENSIKVIKGTPSANPVKPTMASDEGLHQYALAYVTVAANATSITAANIEVNVGKTGCPFVTSVLQQTSITDLFAQWEAEFDTWFDNVQAQLAGDVATNLQLQIDTLKENNFPKATPKETYDTILDNKVVTPADLEGTVPKIGDVRFSTRSSLGDNWLIANGSAFSFGEYNEFYNILRSNADITKFNTLFDTTYSMLNVKDFIFYGNKTYTYSDAPTTLYCANINDASNLTTIIDNDSTIIGVGNVGYYDGFGYLISTFLYNTVYVYKMDPETLSLKLIVTSKHSNSTINGRAIAGYVDGYIITTIIGDKYKKYVNVHNINGDIVYTGFYETSNRNISTAIGKLGNKIVIIYIAASNAGSDSSEYLIEILYTDSPTKGFVQERAAPQTEPNYDLITSVKNVGNKFLFNFTTRRTKTDLGDAIGIGSNIMLLDDVDNISKLSNIFNIVDPSHNESYYAGDYRTLFMFGDEHFGIYIYDFINGDIYKYQNGSVISTGINVGKNLSYRNNSDKPSTFSDVRFAADTNLALLVTDRKEVKWNAVNIVPVITPPSGTTAFIKAREVG